MSNPTIPLNTCEDICQHIERIQQAKIARIESAPAVDLRLTKWDAYEYLSRSCLLKHEVVALLHGMIPHPTETADDYSCMEPDDNVVLRRFLADEKAGRVTTPMLIEEFIEYVTPWWNELPEPLLLGLESRSKEVAGMQICPPITNTDSLERQSSSAFALSEVRRVMLQATLLLEAVGLECGSELPGTKTWYCEYLRRHSVRLKGLEDASLHDYFKQAGYRWTRSGGARRDTDKKIRAALLVPALESQGMLRTVEGNRVRYDGMALFQSNIKT